MNVIAHWLLDNGIGQNVTASALLGGVSVALGWRKAKQLLTRLREHERKVHELHRHLTGGDHADR